MFEECFFRTGRWITSQFLEFIPDILEVNIQIYRVNTNGSGYFFLEQYGENFILSVLLAYIPFSMTNTKRNTRRQELHTMTIPKDSDPNHFDTLLVDDNSIFEVTNGRGTKRGGSGYCGSRFDIYGWVENKVEDMAHAQEESNRKRSSTKRNRDDDVQTIKVFYICVHTYMHTCIHVHNHCEIVSLYLSNPYSCLPNNNYQAFGTKKAKNASTEFDVGVRKRKKTNEQKCIF